MTQPTALFLADILEDAGMPADIAQKCASELRCLHAANVDCMAWYEATKSERDALLEALKQIEPILARMYGTQAAELPPMQIVRAAIAKAEGQQ